MKTSVKLVVKKERNMYNMYNLVTKIAIIITYY
jgi:hypothetical protein